MEVDEVEVIELELKYCERCGGLWLRPRGADGVYCPPCLSKMVRPVIPRRRKGTLGLPANDLHLPGRGQNLAVLCGEGGQA